MTAERFVGRQRELDHLEKWYRSRESAFVPLYGRRRVGKTALLARLLKDRPNVLYFSGLQLPREQQLAAFMKAAADALAAPVLARVVGSDWKEALELVTEHASRKHKLVLALDEYQWIAQTAPELSSVLQQLWDQRWQHSGKMMLILCGSYIGFMERDVLGKASPLYGRRTGSILLGPLRAAEARLLHPSMSLEDAARTYFLCGGVPAYHLAFSSQRSVRQNVADAFFEPGPLSREPTFLLREELREVANYHGVLMALARGTTERKALAKETGLPGGNVSFYLEQLIQLGYVRRF